MALDNFNGQTLLMMLIVFGVILATGALWNMSNQRTYQAEDEKPKRKKHKRAPLSSPQPLDLDIPPHWIRCEVEHFHRDMRDTSIITLRFAFFDEHNTHMYGKTYDRREAGLNSIRLQKRLHIEGFTLTEKVSEHETETFTYERRESEPLS